MSDKAMEDLLEKVAQEVAQKVSEDDTFSTDAIADVLKRRLLPVLEAGQECEFACCGEGHWHYARMKYRAALQAAKGSGS